MPSEGIGVYPGSLTAKENDEVSSTYEGRHLTFKASDITGQEHDLVTKGHPVVIGEHIVGVAFMTEVLGSDLIPIDTEGIWNLMVYPKDDLGAIDVDAGDELWINKSNAEISKIRNSVTHTRFGYALGTVTTVVGNEVIAVKVHWDGDDELEQIGLTGAPFASAEVSRVFRSYFYEATGGSYITGELFELTIPNDADRTYVAAAKSFKLTIPGDAWIVTGNAAVLELYLDVLGVSSENMRTQGVLQLGYRNQNITSVNNYSSAYFLLKDDTVDATFGMARLLTFHDFAALPDGSTSKVLTDSADLTPNSDVRIRCGYGPTAINFWIMCTTTAPTA